MNKYPVEQVIDMGVLYERIPMLYPLLQIPGVYLAGGLLRTVRAGEELSPEKTDVDIFFSYYRALVDAKSMLGNGSGYNQVYQCPADKLASYLWEGAEKWKVQLISVEFYPSLIELVDSFDFTCTMFGTDGVDYVEGETSLEDATAKHLVWNRVTYPSSSLRRMMKYARKGYWMQEEDYNFFVNSIWNHSGEIKDEALVYVD